MWREKAVSGRISNGGSSSSQDKPLPFDRNYGSFFGPAEPIVARSYLEKQRIRQKEIDKEGVKQKQQQVDKQAMMKQKPVINKPKSAAPPRPSLPPQKQKALKLKEARDYSFLFSENAPTTAAQPQQQQPKQQQEQQKQKQQQQKQQQQKQQQQKQQQPQQKQQLLSKPAPKPVVKQVERRLQQHSRPQPQQSRAQTPQSRAQTPQSRAQTPQSRAQTPESRQQSRLPPLIARVEVEAPRKPENRNVHSAAKPSSAPVKASTEPNRPRLSAAATGRPVQAMKASRPSTSSAILTSKPASLKSSNQTSRATPAKPKPRPAQYYNDGYESSDVEVDARSAKKRRAEPDYRSFLPKEFRLRASQYDDSDESSDMEVGFSMIQQEEARSARLAREEDERERILIEEEERRERLRKKKRKY